MKSAAAAALVLLAGSALPSLAPAQTGEGSGPPQASEVNFPGAVRYAENAWLYGDYPQVVEVLAPLLLPEPPVGVEHEQLLAAYELLGASQFMQAGEAAAEETLVALLRLEPDHRMDPLFYPPSLLNYLGELRERYAPELDAIRQARREEVVEEPGQIRFVERRVEEQSLLVSVLPFGIGHFSNGETEWGIFYLTAEVLLGATSMAMFLVNQADMTADGYFPDAALARDRQSIQIGTGIAFFALLAANVAHGAFIHQDEIETSYGILDEPPADFLAPQNRAPFWLGASLPF